MATDNTLNKLIILFVFDKMEIALAEETILDLCTSSNSWVHYMDCKQNIDVLVQSGFIHPSTTAQGRTLYSITPDGRACLSCFYTRIPASLREEISYYVKENRMNFRRRQEYFRDYFKNADGTYTVVLKISDVTQQILEIKMQVNTRNDAINIYRKWEERAGNIYASLLEQLSD